MMVFVPVTRGEATALREQGVLGPGLVGHAATPALMSSHDYDESTREDAEYAALTYAGARAALTGEAGTLRLVLAVEVPPAVASVDPEDAYGRTEISALRWADVRALFADEPAAGAALALARRAADGLELGEALDTPELAGLVDEHDLLWFAPEELDQLS
jgi:hypothetical protein